MAGETNYKHRERRGGRGHGASSLRVSVFSVVSVLSVFAVGFFVAPAAALAQDASLTDARFVDHCLGQPTEAVKLYEKAISGQKINPKERAEAQYAIARARAIEGRRELAASLLEKIAEGAGDGALGTWPGKARAALDRLAAGENPFGEGADKRGAEGNQSVEATAQPIAAVLRDLMAKTGVSFAIDPACPAEWTVSVFLTDLPLEELLDKIVGTGRWRRVGDGMAIGPIAADGIAFERAFDWADVKTPAGRALGAKICSTRVTLNFGAVRLGEVVQKLNALGVCEVKVPPMYEDRPVRVFAKDLRFDHALDLIAVPLKLEWSALDGRVVMQPRKEKEE